MQARMLVIGLVGVGLLGVLVKRQCDRCTAAAPVEEAAVQALEVDKFPVVPVDTTPAESLEACLFKSITLKLEDQTLRQALAELQRASGANLVLDEAALEEAGVNREQRLSLRVENMSCRSALNILVQQMKLAFVIRDEAVVVTTEKGAEGKLAQVVYNVADLVVPVENHPLHSINSLDNLNKALERHIRNNSGPVFEGTQHSLPDLLVNLITETVAAESWKLSGGQGRIQYFPLGMALVVNQTARVHEEIKELLTKLRRLQDIEVVLDMRVFRCPASLLTRCGLDGDAEDGPELLEVVHLDERSGKELVEALEGDCKSNVMYRAPKLTVFNGQRAAIKSVDEQVHAVGHEASDKNDAEARKQVLRSGYRIAVCPTVSEDCRAVRVNLEACLSHVDVADDAKSRPCTSTLRVERSLNVPEGKSVLLHCGSMKEQRNACPEWLREIPGVGAVLRQLGTNSEETQVAILITPRIVVAHAEEEIFLGDRPPVNGYSADPNARLQQLLDQSEDLRQIRAEWGRFWMTDQPSNTTPVRVEATVPRP